jgi:hypothetical protein
MVKRFTPVEQGAITWHVNNVFAEEFKPYVGAARRPTLRVRVYHAWWRDFRNDDER